MTAISLTESESSRYSDVGVKSRQDMVRLRNFWRIGVVMDHLTDDGSESRFSAYVEGLVEVIGHADRASPLRDYCLGLLMPGERKSIEPMAALTAPARVAAQH